MSSHLGSGASAVHGGAFARTVGFCDPCAMQQKKKKKAGVGGGGGGRTDQGICKLVD